MALNLSNHLLFFFFFKSAKVMVACPHLLKREGTDSKKRAREGESKIKRKAERKTEEGKGQEGAEL